jgi:hypothetical protein
MMTLGARRVSLACNQQAAQQTGANALPAPPGAPGTEVTQRTPDGTREPRELSAHGGVPVAGRPETTDPSDSFISQSPDPFLHGMAADRADDPAYRAVYRDCMRVKTRG